MGVERLNEGLLASDIICFSDFEGLGDFGMDAHKQLFDNNTRLSDCVKNYLLEMKISNRAPGSIANCRRILGDLENYAEEADWTDSVYDVDRNFMVEYL